LKDALAWLERAKNKGSKSVKKSSNRFDEMIDSVKKAKAGMNFDLQKGVHDAMFFHRAHAEAAQMASNHAQDPMIRASAAKAAKQHMFMFMRHALENCRDREYWSMRSAMQRALDYFDSEVYGDDIQALKDHYFDGGAFIASPDDGQFIEDYEHGVPNLEKRGK
jgi:hypothetical protein